MDTTTRRRMQGTTYPMMVIGQDKLAYSVVSNLLAAGQEVLLLTADKESAERAIYEEIGMGYKNLQIQTAWPSTISSELVILVTKDQVDTKVDLIRQIEDKATEKTIIATNIEAVHLDELQAHSRNPSKIFGLNWTYPAHRTFFAEIVANDSSDANDLARLFAWAKESWRKDPYIVKTGFSTRARMLAAMIREGLYLVENGYASIESVDRACRNDAGYYLPFAGNFRYMDLMGTYAYGMVMEGLNKELSAMDSLPKTLQEMKYKGEGGMDSGQGFYAYSSEEKAHWQAIFEAFSQEIQELILKYPHEPLDH